MSSFIGFGAGPAAIWKVSIEGGPPVPVSRLTNATTEGVLSISPDGKRLAFRYVSVQPEAGSAEYRMQIGAARQTAPPSRNCSTFRRVARSFNGRPIPAVFYYVAGTPNSSSLWRQPLDGSEPQKLCEFPDRISNFAWSHDGKNLVVSRGKQHGDAILITNLP